MKCVYCENEVGKQFQQAQPYYFQLERGDAIMYKLCFFVPATHVEEVKTAVFATGAGRIGDYDSCCWQTLGQGQFRPLPGSQPFIGETDKVETVEEFKVELVCEESLLKSALQALIKSHPYEEPAYDVWSLLDPVDLDKK